MKEQKGKGAVHAESQQEMNGLQPLTRDGNCIAFMAAAETPRSLYTRWRVMSSCSQLSALDRIVGVKARGDIQILITFYVHQKTWVAELRAAWQTQHRQVNSHPSSHSITAAVGGERPVATALFAGWIFKDGRHIRGTAGTKVAISTCWLPSVT